MTHHLNKEPKVGDSVITKLPFLWDVKGIITEHVGQWPDWYEIKLETGTTIRASYTLADFEVIGNETN